MRSVSAFRVPAMASTGGVRSLCSQRGSPIPSGLGAQAGRPRERARRRSAGPASSPPPPPTPLVEEGEERPVQQARGAAAPPPPPLFSPGFVTPKISVLGVGGGGGNAVNNMYGNIDGVEFLIANTDAQALNLSPVANKFQFGTGLGAGGNPAVGRSSAETSMDGILDLVADSNMVFIAAGMGGGTGTGASPIIAHEISSMGILTVGVVTKPFDFEGRKRLQVAEEGIAALEDQVDTLIVVPNQNLTLREGGHKLLLGDAFKMVDDVLCTGVGSITDLMMKPGIMNLDFADVESVMRNMGRAIMGTGIAKGDNRAEQAAWAAVNNDLLEDTNLEGAHGVLINVSGSDLTLDDITQAAHAITSQCHHEANVITGASIDESLDGHVRVCVVATGIGPSA